MNRAKARGPDGDAETGEPWKRSEGRQLSDMQPAASLTGIAGSRLEATHESHTDERWRLRQHADVLLDMDSGDR